MRFFTSNHQSTTTLNWSNDHIKNYAISTVMNRIEKFKNCKEDEKIVGGEVEYYCLEI